MYYYLPVREQLSSPYVGNYVAYGIRALETDGGDWREVAFVSDISTSSSFTKRLAKLFTDGQLAPIHFLDAVLDAIEAPVSHQ